MIFWLSQLQDFKHMNSGGINTRVSAQKNRTGSQHILSLQEKILLEKRIDYVPDSQSKGATIELFFHELTGKETFPKKIFGVIAGFIGLLLFLATFLFFALLLGFFSKGRVIVKKQSVGFRAEPFTCYFYRTQKLNDKEKITFLGWLLLKTGLYKLPNTINMLKGEMAFVGPESLSVDESETYNAHLTDFYKRYATRPGLITVKKLSWKEADNFKTVSDSLESELRYVANPSLKKDLKIIAGKLRD